MHIGKPPTAIEKLADVIVEGGDGHSKLLNPVSPAKRSKPSGKMCSSVMDSVGGERLSNVSRELIVID